MPLMRALSAASSFAVLCLATLPAAGEERPARASVALLAGYGLQLDSVVASGVSAYKLGFGTRAGVTLPFGGYVGGTYVQHTGTNIVGRRDGVAIFATIAHDTYFGPEVGFDFQLWRLLLRPYLGTGILVAFGKTVVDRSTFSDDGAFFYVAPGGLVAYRLAALIAGVDLRIPIVPAQSGNKWAPTALLTVGMVFGGDRP